MWYKNLHWFVMGYNFYPQSFLYYIPFPWNRNRKLDKNQTWSQVMTNPMHTQRVTLAVLKFKIFIHTFLSLIGIFSENECNLSKKRAKFLFAVFYAERQVMQKHSVQGAWGHSLPISSFHFIVSPFFFVFVAVGTWPSLCRLRPTGNKWSHFL